MDQSRYEHILSFLVHHEYYDEFSNFISKDMNNDFHGNYDIFLSYPCLIEACAWSKDIRFVEKAIECGAKITNTTLRNFECNNHELFLKYITKNILKNYDIKNNKLKILLLKNNYDIDVNKINIKYLDIDEIKYLFENHHDIEINIEELDKDKIEYLLENHYNSFTDKMKEKIDLNMFFNKIEILDNKYGNLSK